MHAVRVNPWRATFSAFCASLVGIGLARFAYTPLLPAIIAGHWFKPSVAAYLGAANLAGYLAGAVLGRSLAARISVALTLQLMMGLATAAFFACAFPISFLWFFAWRFVAGLSGGALMVLAAPAVLPHLPAARRGLAGGLIFMGVGVGIAASGTLVPLLLRLGLAQAWLGLGVLSCVLTIAAWRGWPTAAAPVVAMPHASALAAGHKAAGAISRICAQRGRACAAYDFPRRFRRPGAWPGRCRSARNIGCCLGSARWWDHC